MAPVKTVPVMVISLPTGPLAGVKLVIVGLGMVTVKFAALVAEPCDVVTVILPVVAPAGTVAFTDVAETGVIVVAALPLNVMLVAPVRNVPAMATTVPAGPLVGVKLVTVGGVVTVYVAVLIAVPAGATIVILPEVAPAGTVALTEVAEVTVNVVAAFPLNLTAVAPVRLVPVITTAVPTGPLTGVKLVIVAG